MDPKNRFLTAGTYALFRLEYLILSAWLIGLAAIHRNQINWWLFLLLIALTDGIGYVLGAVAHRRRANRRTVAPVHYILYNTMHSLFFTAAVGGLWWLTWGSDWTMLALPIHLCIDRSVFGNFFKPIGGVAFEPELHPAFAEFEQKFEQERRLERART